MKSIFTGIAALALALGIAATAQAGGFERDGGIQRLIGEVNLPQQSPSAPGCMRNPPPSQC